MHFFGYSFAPPFLTYHVADAAGELVKSVEIPVPGPTMVHDFAITERHAIFMDLPVVFSGERLVEGGMPYAWSDDYGARLGVMPRGGSNAEELSLVRDRALLRLPSDERLQRRKPIRS